MANVTFHRGSDATYNGVTTDGAISFNTGNYTITVGDGSSANIVANKTTVTQSLRSGYKLATVTYGGASTSIYAPKYLKCVSSTSLSSNTSKYVYLIIWTKGGGETDAYGYTSCSIAVPGNSSYYYAQSTGKNSTDYVYGTPTMVQNSSSQWVTAVPRYYTTWDGSVTPTGKGITWQAVTTSATSSPSTITVSGTTTVYQVELAP